MKMKFILFIFLLISNNLLADEMSDRNQIINKVKMLFLNSEYSELTKISNKYLSEGSRTDSGKWKLDLFYTGIGYTVKEKSFNELEKIALGWIDAYPNSSTAYISYAKILVEKAWLSRGTKLSTYTTKQQFNDFKNYMEKARIYLNKHKKNISNNPGWYSLMLNISKGQSWKKEKFYTLLDEAILKHPYYNSIYYGALFRMDPKWGDFSKEEIETIAQKALLATKEKGENSRYARFYWVASQLIYHKNLFTQSDVNWSIMRKGIDDVLKEFPSQWNINYFAYYSCLAEDKSKAKELLSRITSKPKYYPWGYNDIEYKKCLEWVNHDDNSSNNMNYIKEISIDDLEDYIDTKTINKPTYIHFASYKNSSSLGEKEFINALAKKHHKKMNFILINMLKTDINTKTRLFIKYRLRHDPFSMIVHNKKIVKRLERIPYDRENVISYSINNYLAEKKDSQYFAQFKNSLIDKGSLLNSEENIRDNMLDYYEKKPYKATAAAAIDFSTSHWAFGRVLNETSQEQANKKALLECEDDRKKFRIKAKCQLHMIGDQYVFEKTEDEIKKIIKFYN